MKYIRLFNKTSDYISTKNNLIKPYVCTVSNDNYVLYGNNDRSNNIISCYTGNTEPRNEEGNDGDIYILINESNSSIGEIDSNNNISLNDELPNDTYTLKYEDTNGNPINEWAEIGTINKY